MAPLYSIKTYLLIVLTLFACLSSCNNRSQSSNNEHLLVVEELDEDEGVSEEVESEPTIVESPDGIIRFIGNNNHTGGIASGWSSIYQIRDKGQIYTFEGLPDWDGEPALITAIYCLPHPKRNLYLFDAYFRYSGSGAYQAFVAYERIEHTLKRVSVLRNDEGNLCNEIGFEFNVPDYYFRFARSLGYENLYKWSEHESVLYYPIGYNENGARLTDKYVRYIWNEQTLEPTTDTVCNPRLYEPLQNYVACLQHTKAGYVQVRVDSLADGQLRYSAWDRNKDISTEPNIVLYGKSVGDAYHFFNQTYTYVVTREEIPEVHIYYSSTPGQLGELSNTYKEE